MNKQGTPRRLGRGTTGGNRIMAARAALGAGLLLALLLVGGLTALSARAAPADAVVMPPCDEAALDAALAVGGTITFDCGPDTVTITVTSEKLITQTTDLDGGGLIVLSGGGTTRLFNVEAGVVFGLANLILRDGNALTNTPNGGGAVYSEGELRLDNVDLLSNIGYFGGAVSMGDGSADIQAARFISNTGYFGAGLAADEAGQIDVRDSHFSGGEAGDSGGGLYVVDSTGLNIQNSRFQGNEALIGSGGGLYARLPLLLQDSTVHDNVAEGLGAGIYLSGTARLEAVTVSANESIIQSGGGLHIAPGAEVELINSTVSGNFISEVGTTGGGLDIADTAVVTLTNTTVAGNIADAAGGNFSGPATVVNTLIANGTPDNCADALTSLGHNLEDANTCGLGEPTDITNGDPALAPLADNGGLTQTHALQAGSQAIDAGDPAACPPLDQRGEPRPQDGDGDGTAVCDIGAYEVVVELFRMFFPILMNE